MKTPVNKESLKHHFTYNWWKYLFVLIAGIFLVDLLFTVTTPKIPEDKRIDFYVYGYVNGDTFGDYMEEIRQRDLPDVEYTSCISLSVDDTYGAMQLTTYIAAQEGDLYLLPRDEFLSLSSAGAFLPLEDDEELMAVFNEAGIDLRRGWRTDSDTGETHLYGIPLDFLPGLSQYCYAADGFISVLVANGNTDNVMTFLRILSREMLSAPELPAQEEAAPEPATETP